MAKILVVDDDRDAGETAVKLFETAGHEATYAPNGKEALSHVLNAIPDAVLLDLAMPEMDGPSFLEVVRSYLRLQSLPVVVLTGLAESPMVTRAQSLKVNSVLVKGKASPEEILHAIQEALARMPG
jgi:CheY-like chemotaxis protein